MERRASAHAGIRGSRSFKRLDFAQRSTIEIILPVMILLIFDVPVAGKKEVPFAIGEREKFTVLLAPETDFLDRFAFVAKGAEAVFDWSGKTLIHQDFHLPKRARTRAFASSNAATAVSRLTPGKCSRKTSNVSPPSR
jgi:hypothetical protein